MTDRDRAVRQVLRLHSHAPAVEVRAAYDAATEDVRAAVDAAGGLPEPRRRTPDQLVKHADRQRRRARVCQLLGLSTSATVAEVEAAIGTDDALRARVAAIMDPATPLPPKPPKPPKREYITDLERDRRRRGVCRVLHLSSAARGDAVQRAFEQAAPDVQARVTRIREGAEAPPPPISRGFQRKASGATGPDEHYEPRAPKMKPRARFMPNPEEFRQATAKRDHYVNTVGLWPDRYLKPKARTHTAPGLPVRFEPEPDLPEPPDLEPVTGLEIAAEGV